MKLIKEHIEAVRYLTEKTEDGKKQMYIEGIFLVGDTVNRNNRMYEMKTLRNEVARYTKDLIESNRALGELGHPDTPSLNLERVSHKIVSLKEDGNTFVGKALIMETPYGLIAKNLIESGVNLGVSSRALGSVVMTKEGYNLVQDDLRLATAADIVADPSAPDAFVNGIMEGKEWCWEGGILRERAAEAAKRKINTLVDQKRLEEQKVDLFQNFLSNL
jgi:hypothetical protein